ncbi:hypothetical protein [Nonomuraea sp. LPB2021202275-12-8]|uniref:hypothetical protein n=1 Tax=Nonomuraea sp. LPB2021202275-12-8 TaxID=3120159 RepID=UPI00300C9345
MSPATEVIVTISVSLNVALMVGIVAAMLLVPPIGVLASGGTAFATAFGLVSVLVDKFKRP